MLDINGNLDVNNNFFENFEIKIIDQNKVIKNISKTENFNFLKRIDL